MRKAMAMIFALALAVAGFASAEEAPSAAVDPVLERRVTAIAEELRCLVCQNQTIADSHAELAVDLKNQVREMLRKGMSEAAIKSYMVERYGDFVLYRPPVKATTSILWAGPFVLLVGGLGFLYFKLRQRARRQQMQPVGLSEQEHERALDLLSPK